jgi:Ni/Co efflux regulator RcnB
MKSVIFASVCALALVGATASAATTGQADQRQRADARTSQSGQSAHFDDHARQTTQDWYKQHQNNAPVGLRSRDRLTSSQESRLEVGKPIPRDLRSHIHTAPRDLTRQLPPPPPHHRYVAVGGHVGLVDDVSHVLRDVIHLHGQ